MAPTSRASIGVIAMTLNGVQKEKLVIDLPEGDVASAETLWVTREAVPAYFKIANIPIYAYGIALDDVVRAEQRDDGRLHFVEVVKPSGLLTVRVGGLDADEGRFGKIVKLLNSKSVASESHGRQYVAYALEAGAFSEIESAIDALEDGERLVVEVAND